MWDILASGLLRPAPVGRCPGSMVDVPQQGFQVWRPGMLLGGVFRGQGGQLCLHRRPAGWAPWPGRQAIHAPTPHPGSAPGQLLGSCSWGSGEDGEETPEGFWRLRAGLGLVGALPRVQGRRKGTPGPKAEHQQSRGRGG